MDQINTGSNIEGGVKIEDDSRIKQFEIYNFSNRNNISSSKQNPINNNYYYPMHELELKILYKRT